MYSKHDQGRWDDIFTGKYDQKRHHEVCHILTRKEWNSIILKPLLHVHCTYISFYAIKKGQCNNDIFITSRFWVNRHKHGRYNYYLKQNNKV